MTDVYLERDGDRYVLSCKGHAAGSPALCAAVSALVYAAAGWVRNEPGAERLTERLESGDALLVWIAPGEGPVAVFRLLTVAFLQLEASDRERLRVAQVGD